MNKKVIILSNNSTECLSSTYFNYSSCEDLSPNTSIIELSRIKELYSSLDYKPVDPPFLYIVDKGNHCIRALNLKEFTVKTIAGMCGV